MSLPNTLERKRFDRNRVGLAMVCLAFALLSAMAVRADSSVSKAKPDSPGDDIFRDTNIVRLRIELSEEAVQSLRGHRWRRPFRGRPWEGRGNRFPQGVPFRNDEEEEQAERPEVSATIVEGGHTYTNVAVHLKGSAGSFRPVDGKPGWTLNFDKNAPGQRFHGLRKISLNNSAQDETFITEKLCREIFAASGVPAPRADFATVSLNGRDLGLYVLLEGYNKQFLKRHFQNTGGNLYDSGFCQDTTEALAVNSGDQPTDRSDLQRLTDAAARARRQNRLDELGQVLDLDRFFTMVALEVILCHWDGYSMNRNNYRLYHDMDRDRMVFMPHGMDQMFGRGGRGTTDLPLVPRMNAFVANMAMGTSDGMARYRARLKELRGSVFNVPALAARARELEARLRPVLSGESGDVAERHHAAVDYLCQKMEERAQILDSQLGLPGSLQSTPGLLPLEFGAYGLARLEKWTLGPRFGMAPADPITERDGRRALRLAANRQTWTPSWRSRVLLKKGRYRFEGFGMASGVLDRWNGGLGFRVSGVQMPFRRPPDGEWTKLLFSFEVEQPMAEVELVCELRGFGGEAWFDLDSLRLRRIAER